MPLELDAKRPMDLLKSLIPTERTPEPVSDKDVERADKVSTAGIEKAPAPKVGKIEKAPAPADVKVDKTPEVKHTSDDPIHKFGMRLGDHLAKIKACLRHDMRATGEKEVEDLLAAFRALEAGSKSRHK